MVRGRIPKEGGSTNRNMEMVEVQNIPYTSQKGKPKIPRAWSTWQAGELLEMPVPTEAKNWWNTISQMPHCALWTASDWAFFKSTFYLACHCYTGEAKYFGELRQREAKMGVTAGDRLALRIRYVEPEAPASNANNVISIPSRSQMRERLAGGN